MCIMSESTSTPSMRVVYQANQPMLQSVQSVRNMLHHTARQHVGKKVQVQKRRNLFEVLANINDVVMLDDLHIIDGQIDIRMSGGMNLVMKNATLSVESRSLLESDKLSSIRRSVNYLDFKKGILKIDDIKP